MPFISRSLRAACLLSVALASASCQRDDATPAASPSSDPADSAPQSVPGPATPAAAPPDPASDANPARIVKAMPDADTPTPAVAVGAAITYGCDDGNLVVTYRGPAAALVLPDGSSATATLSVEESAKAGGEVYVGDRLGLRRIGNVVELQSADAPARRCLETGGTA